MNIVKETIGNICGSDFEGTPKGTMMLQVYTLNTITKELVTMNYSIMTKNPTYRIQRHDDFVQLDIRFLSSLHDDFRKIWDCLEGYGKLLDIYAEDQSKVVMTTITLIPSTGQYSHYIRILNPIFWTMQPDMPGEECNNIRIISSAIDFGIMQIVND